MAYKVLVVDDSTFFRRRVTDILNQSPELEVIGEAKDGKEAVELAATLKPDVITMDVEMPVLDGISAVRQIMQQSPVPILMFSSLTHEGASATLDALDAGALDFLPKKFEDIARNRSEAVESLQQKVLAIGKRKSSIARFPRTLASNVAPSAPGITRQTKTFIRSSSSIIGQSSAPTPYRTANRRYKLLAIGTSTGGPVALQSILTKLPASFPCPIILVQHMPGTFTSAFADRLNNLCQIQVREAKNGDALEPGVAYLAPGGKQMLLEGTTSTARIKITDSDNMEQITYKPSVDLSFASAARLFEGDVLGIILTGMGADGREGCRTLKNKGARIWAQDEKTSVVYGMPQAVTAAGIAEKNFPLEEFSKQIMQEIPG